MDLHHCLRISACATPRRFNLVMCPIAWLGNWLLSEEAGMRANEGTQHNNTTSGIHHKYQMRDIDLKSSHTTAGNFLLYFSAIPTYPPCSPSTGYMGEALVGASKFEDEMDKWNFFICVHSLGVCRQR